MRVCNGQFFSEGCIVINLGCSCRRTALQFSQPISFRCHFYKSDPNSKEFSMNNQAASTTPTFAERLRISVRQQLASVAISVALILSLAFSANSWGQAVSQPADNAVPVADSNSSSPQLDSPTKS